MTVAPAPRRGHPGAWTLATVQVGFAVSYLAAAGLVLAQLGGGWVWSEPVSMLLTLGPILAGLLIWPSAILFLIGHCRGDRRLTTALLIGAGLTLLVLVLSLTPTGRLLAGWLSD